MFFAWTAGRRQPRQSPCSRRAVLLCLVALGLFSPAAFLRADEPPEFQQQQIAGGYLFEIQEGAAHDAAVGTIVARDPDGESLVYSLAPPGAPFVINIASGEISVFLPRGGSLDFEETSSYVVTVTATESRDDRDATETPLHEEQSASIEVRILIQDVDDVTPVIQSGQQFIVGSGARHDTELGEIRVLDPDSEDGSFRFTLHTLVPFSIDTEGKLRVKLDPTDQLLSRPTSYELRLSVADAAGHESAIEIVRVVVRSDSNSAERRREIEALGWTHSEVSVEMLFYALRRRLAERRRGDPEGKDYYDYDPDFPGEEQLLSSGKGSAAASFPQHRPPAVPMLAAQMAPALSATGGQGLYDAQEVGGFGTRGATTFWMRGGRRNLDALPALDHGVLDYGGATDALSLGIEQQLNENLAIGVIFGYSESEFEYIVQTFAGPAITKGVYQEESVIAGAYTIISTNAVHLWAVLGGGLGELTDERVALDVASRGVADSRLFLAAAGIEYGTTLGQGWMRLDLDLKASLHGFNRSADDMAYESEVEALEVSGSDGVLADMRFGFEAGLPFSFGFFGRFRPYVSVEAVREIGDYPIGDRGALDVTAGGIWKHGRLQLSYEGYLETLRGARDNQGFSGSIRYLARPGEQGVSISLTSSHGGTRLIDTGAGFLDALREGPLSARKLNHALLLHGGYGFPVTLWGGGVLTAYMQASLEHHYAAGLRFSTSRPWRARLGLESVAGKFAARFVYRRSF